MSFEIAYTLSKDAYPEITIGIQGTTVDHGINGTIIHRPRSINVVIENPSSLISVNDLVKCWKEHHE